MEKQEDKPAYREAILRFAAEQFGTKPEYLWRSAPDYAVLRRADNRKWYGLLMRVPGERLGLQSGEHYDVLDIKCEPALIGSLRLRDGFLPAYHMNKASWLTVLLDGTVALEEIVSLLEQSFALAGPQADRQAPAAGRQEWVFPANPKYFDLKKAFAKSPEITWHQRNRIAVGDLVYLYLTEPVGAICYKCQVLETDIPRDPNKGRNRASRSIRMRLLAEYDPSAYPREFLRQHGLFAVRSPRHMPQSLVRKIEGSGEAAGR